MNCRSLTNRILYFCIKSVRYNTTFADMAILRSILISGFEAIMSSANDWISDEF